MAILPGISGPQDVKRLDAKQLDELAAELRQTIIDTVSQRGGHLASNLGDVELTIALHRAFNSPTDKLVFDVGHQIYAHKLLTGRQEQFKTLRSYHGMSGFPCHAESEHDLFDTGHSSTSISMALGLARARDLNHEDYHVVAIVGDGALTGGMCYEAMNDAGNGHTRLIVVLNDNEMSISKNVGALSEYFKHLRASASWYGNKKRIRNQLTHIPLIGKPLAHAIENAKNMVKSVTTGGEMFEALGFRYLGPFDGHNIEEMTHVFEEAKQVQDMPLLIHVITKKGYGYDLAERQPEKFHGVAPFRVENGAVVTETNHCGGILGGITDGMPIVLRAAFKPTPSIARTQQSVNLQSVTREELAITGRHDPCIVPRAVPCVEAAVAVAVYDALLARR